MTKLLDLFPVRERRLFGLVMLVALVAAVFEMIGVASIAPFMGAMLDDRMLERSPFLSSVLVQFGAKSREERLITFGILTLCALVLSNAASAASLYVQQRFTARSRTRLGAVMFRGYLSRPYAFHIRRDAPSLLKVLLNDTDSVAIAVGSIQVVASRLVIIVALVSLLVYTEPVVAMTTLTVLGGTYTLAYGLMRRAQRALGQKQAEARETRARVSQESLGGIKELLLLGRTDNAAGMYLDAVRTVAATESQNTIAGQIPRYLLESVGYGGLILTTLALVSRDGSASTALPTLALYAFAAYRLLPAMQQLFYALMSVQYAQPLIDGVWRDWHEVQVPARTFSSHVPFSITSRAGAQRRVPPHLELRNVEFTHEGTTRPALHGLSLVIEPGQSVGLVGRTGAGKTTLVDLLLGLYRPTDGAVLMNSKALDEEDYHLLRSQVGYVSQHVFLANASVAANVALGLRAEDIDAAAVARALTLANADEFVRKLPRGVDTEIGERGVRLSGGQRQRIGIARALYGAPSVLVFDEATSALDGMTEDAVMEAIRRLSGERTVILIAHRLRTVQACDRIIMLDDGAIVATGSWTELSATVPEFRELSQGRDRAPAA